MTESNFIPPEVDALNEQMSAFEFVVRLASDGSNAVYMAKQKSLDRKAAIKFYSHELSRSPAFRESFAATTKVMAKLKHPNLIGVYDSGIEQDMLYLVTEFVAGKPLWNSTKGEPVHIKHVQTLVEGICVGMAHAHKNNICHGALSLKNILLDETRMPKIGGFSQATGDTSKLDPSALRFRAPELADDGAKPTPQSDIYSIAVILREMAVGQTQGVDALANIEKIGPALKRLVEKATSPDPSKRYRTVEEFYEEMLDAFDPSSVKKPAGALLKTGAVKLPPGGAKPGGPKPGSPIGKPSVSPTPMMPVKPASSVKIWVHILIIIVLLFAIRVAWNALKTKKERNNATQSAVQSSPTYKPIPAYRPKPKRNNDPDSAAGRTIIDDFPDDSNPQPEIQKPQRDSAKELMRLRHALIRGSRSEMPEGTVEMGNHYFYHVNIPMTWSDAFWFAEDHGGYLAIPDAKATAEWIRKEVVGSGDQSFWLGAAKSGQHSWALTDGRPWRPQDPSVSLGEYVAVGPDGQVIGEQGEVRREFVMQWTKNGSNPGSLEALLKVTKDSLTTAAPVYPPGTKAFGVRHFLYVPKITNWKDAVLSARASGGSLAVIGGIAEKFNIEKLVKDATAPEGIWLGGFHLEGKGWRWTTGENWLSSDWPQSKAPKTADASLFMLPNGTWDEKSRDTKASGYIIEWSDDHKNARK